MTTLLDEGLRAIRQQPPDRQDLAGEVLLTIARQAEIGATLTPREPGPMIRTCTSPCSHRAVMW